MYTGIKGEKEKKEIEDQVADQAQDLKDQLSRMLNTMKY